MVLGWHFAYDVVVQEGPKALGGAGLWRRDVEVGRGGVAWLGVEVDKRHLDLVTIRPDPLKAVRNGATRIAIRQACGLDTGSRGQEECQARDGYCFDSDTGCIA